MSDKIATRLPLVHKLLDAHREEPALTNPGGPFAVLQRGDHYVDARHVLEEGLSEEKLHGFSPSDRLMLFAQLIEARAMQTDQRELVGNLSPRLSVAKTLDFMLNAMDKEHLPGSVLAAAVEFEKMLEGLAARPESARTGLEPLSPDQLAAGENPHDRWFVGSLIDSDAHTRLGTEGLPQTGALPDDVVQRLEALLQKFVGGAADKA